MKHKFLKNSIIVMIWTTGLFAHGQEQILNRTFSLKEAQEFAIENNLNISNARLDVEHAQNLIWENTAIGLPQVNSSINYNNNLNLTTSLLPAEIFGGTPGEMIEVQFGTQHNATASISASQLIFSGPYIVGLQAANIFKKSTEQNLVKKEIEIKELIALNYYLVLLAEDSYITIDSNVQNLKKTLYETQKMYESGFVEETEVDQIRVSLISLENSLRSARTQIEVAYKLLKYQLGIDLRTEIKLSESLNGIIQKINLEQTLVGPFIVNNHIDYQLLQTQEELAQLQLKRMKSEYLPSLNAIYNNNWSAMRNQFDFFDSDETWYYSSMLGFTLNIPIFSSGSRKARVSEKRIEYEKAGNLKKMTEDGLVLENQQARSDFVSAYEKYLSEKENVALSNKILERTRIKVQEGFASSLDFTQINNQYLATESNYFSAMVQLLNAKIRLDKAMNRL
ncbi:MAG: TolC family protein [Bacteroidota bacterium]|nr:TolC family protein [Bacteroidota bacterium]